MNAKQRVRLHGTVAKRLATAVGVTLTAAAALVVFRGLAVQGVVVLSDSMASTLEPGDVVLVNRAATGGRIPLLGSRVPGYSQVRHGDILVFEVPGGGGQAFAKRVVGVPGDTVWMERRTLYRNGERVVEPYAHHGGADDEYDAGMVWQRQYLTSKPADRPYAPTRDHWGPLVVPDGGYFVLGDNRDASTDSRYWGFVSEQLIRGRAALVYFSYAPESDTTRRVRWNRIGTDL